MFFVKSITEKIHLIRIVGILSFIAFSVLSISLVLFVFSSLLFYLRDEFFIPPFWISLSLTFAFLIAVSLWGIKLFRVLVPSLGTVEDKIFGERKLIVDTIIQLEKESKDPRDYIRSFDEVEKKVDNLTIDYLKKFVILVFSLIIAITLFFTYFKIVFVDFYKFLSRDFKVSYNSFVSTDVPLKVEVSPHFKVGNVFVVVGDKVSELVRKENKFAGELAINEPKKDDEVLTFRVLIKKYGLIWDLTNVNVSFVGTFKLLSNYVRVLYNGFEISSYDYVPDLNIVKGSEVVFEFIFSHRLSSVSIKGSNLGFIKNLSNNVAKISVTPVVGSAVNFSFTDSMGRTFELGPVYISIRTNDIPNVSIKYPEKDIMITLPSFLLDGFGEIVDNDNIIFADAYASVSNTLTSYVRKVKDLNFKFDSSTFTFSLDSKKEGLLPGDNVIINVIAKDVYGAVGVGTRIVYLPTFSQLAKMLENELKNVSNQISSTKEDVFDLKDTISDTSISEISKRTKILDKIEKLRNAISNIASSGEKLEEVLDTLDKYKSLSEEVNKLKNIREKLEKIMEDKEFNEIVSKLSSKANLNYEGLNKKIDDLGRALTELEMEVKKINEFKDVIKTVSRFSDIENSIMRNLEANNNKGNSEIDKQLQEFMNSEEFKKLRENLKSSLMDKIKALKNSMNKKDSQGIQNAIKDINFELFKELMKSMAELQNKQRNELWDRYLEVLNSQVLLIKSKDSLDNLRLIYPRIDKFRMSNEISLVNEAFKVYRISVSKLINSVYLDISLSEDIFEIEKLLRGIEDNFYAFSSVVSSGSTYELVEILAGSINLTSFTLKKILDLGDKMREGINLSPSGVSMSELMEMYKQISSMLKDIMEGKGDSGILKELERLVRKAIEKAKSLEASRPGDGNAKEVREELEKILDEIVRGNYSSAYDMTQKLDFNTLEYQRGMFEKGISEKREAEKPKPFKSERIDNIVESVKLEKLKSRYLRSKYIEVINNYRKAIMGD
jgi:hypothetical protein